MEILQDAKAIAQEVSTVQAERCYELQDNVDRLLACIAKEQKEKYAKSEFLCSQVCALTTKHSWNPKEWDGNIWSESSDSNIESEFDPDLNGREVVGAQPPIETMLQQEQADEGKQMAHTHSPKELTHFQRSLSRRAGKEFQHRFCQLGIVELCLSIY